MRYEGIGYEMLDGIVADLQFAIGINAVDAAKFTDNNIPKLPLFIQAFSLRGLDQFIGDVRYVGVPVLEI
jgi:hypothetical protein